MTNELGWRCQLKTCAACGFLYTETWIPHFGTTGACEKCQRQQADADAYMAMADTQAEVRRRIAEALATSERDIAEAADCALEAHLKTYREDALSFYLNEVRGQYHSQLRAGIEDDLRAEYLAKVKA